MAGTRARQLAPGVPSFEVALKALLSGDANRAAALFAARSLADPTDWISRANRAIALYEAGRRAEAATGLEREIVRAGHADLGTVPALFCRRAPGAYSRGPCARHRGRGRLGAPRAEARRGEPSSQPPGAVNGSSSRRTGCWASTRPRCPRGGSTGTKPIGEPRFIAEA